ncbi:MAG: hypothetical protein IT364_16370 [Candidatus Hydrogenedentes bacterium]|nr:hypothetical protein [Candidatus Hydrogenedentota bacterium]
MTFSRFSIAFYLCACTVSYAQDMRPGSTPFTVLWDTGAHASTPLTADDFSQAPNWQVVTPDMVDYRFQGDAIASNDRLALVARDRAAALDFYTLAAGVPRLRAQVSPATPSDAGPVTSVGVLENTQDLVKLAIAFGTDASCALHVELGVGQPHVKTQASGIATGLRVTAPCRFALMPDFFADDIVLDAQSIPVDRTEQPSENFFIHLIDDGNAALMAVWDNRDQDIFVNFSGTGASRTLQSAEIAYGQAGSVWVAALEDPGIWHVRDIAREDLGNELPLAWQPPFKAVWRVDWRRTSGLTDSWEMITQNADGAFAKPELFEDLPENWAGQDWWSSKGGRWRWSTVLGRYAYPCWFDKDGHAFLQPMKMRFNWTTNPEGSFHPLPEESLWVGPAILYPVERTGETPLDKFTVTDVVRATLGVGPCQYILDVEGQQTRFQGAPTCATRDLLNEIYEKGEQVSRKDDVSKALEDVIAFITLIRERIDAYAAFGERMADYLAQQKLARPELADFIGQLETANAGIAAAIEHRREGLKSIAYATELAEKFRQTVAGYEGPDALDRCKAITKEWVGMGDNQDELVAECRVAVKLLRQQAVLAGVTDPRTAEVVKEVREQTQQILRSPVSYEGARH